MKYLPALDGLRGICILLVVLSHAGNGWEKLFPGTLGVVMFFVLSGFLITWQLLDEHAATGRIAVGTFYLRRILRLLPGLLFYLLLFVPLLWWLGADITGTHIAGGVLYIANYYHLFVGYPPYNPMPILWSLSVEAHYYLLFPLLFVLLQGKQHRLLPVMAIGMLSVLLWRIYLYHHCPEGGDYLCGHSERIRTQGTDAIVDTILYGATAAMLLHVYPDTARGLLANRYSLLAALSGLGFCLMDRNGEFRETLRYSIESAAGALIIVTIVYGNCVHLHRLLANRLMVFIGTLSYPLYLCHFGVLITIEALNREQRLNGIKETMLYITASFAISMLCYYMVEKRVIRIRKNSKAPAL